LFQFRLCAHLKYPHPDYLLPLLTASQLAEWRAVDAIEPLGNQQTNILLAEVASFLYSRYRDPAKRPEPYSVYDFMHNMERPQQTPEEVSSQIAKYFSRYAN
jgi:hypothetical protein